MFSKGSAPSLKPSDILSYSLFNARLLKTQIADAAPLTISTASVSKSSAKAAPTASLQPKQPITSSLQVPLLDTPASVATFLKSQDTLLFDCDGVLYRDTSVTPNTPKVLSYLQNELGKKVIFCTNTSSRSRVAMSKALSKKMGLALSPEQMCPSSWALAQYVKKHLPHVRKAYVIGGQGIIDELALVGVEAIGGPSPKDITSFTEKDITSWRADPSVDAVIMGMATDFSYRKLCEATMYLQNPKCEFISTNNDAFDILGADLRRQPANGPLVSAVEHSSGKKARCVGKPSVYLFEAVVEEHSIKPSRTVMIGDRMDTDIRFGHDHGMNTVLVLSGCTTGEKFGAHEPTVEEPLPTVVIPHIGLFLGGEEEIASKL